MYLKEPLQKKCMKYVAVVCLMLLVFFPVVSAENISDTVSVPSDRSSDSADFVNQREAEQLKAQDMAQEEEEEDDGGNDQMLMAAAAGVGALLLGLGIWAYMRSGEEAAHDAARDAILAALATEQTALEKQWVSAIQIAGEEVPPAIEEEAEKLSGMAKTLTGYSSCSGLTAVVASLEAKSTILTQASTALQLAGKKALSAQVVAKQTLHTALAATTSASATAGSARAAAAVAVNSASATPTVATTNYRKLPGEFDPVLISEKRGLEAKNVYVATLVREGETFARVAAAESKKIQEVSTELPNDMANLAAAISGCPTLNLAAMPFIASLEKIETQLDALNSIIEEKIAELKMVDAKLALLATQRTEDGLQEVATQLAKKGSDAKNLNNKEITSMFYDNTLGITSPSTEFSASQLVLVSTPLRAAAASVISYTT
jgi:hypothetical protein